MSSPIETVIANCATEASRDRAGLAVSVPPRGDTNRASMDLGTDGAVLLKCRSPYCPDCMTTELDMRLFNSTYDRLSNEDRVVRAYDYDESGNLLFQAVRLHDPTKGRTSDSGGRGKGGWIWKQ